MTHEQTRAEVTFSGEVKIAGMPPFYFATKAPTESKAKSNGIAQFAKKCNMSIAQFRAQLKKTSHDVRVHQKVK